jgi:hypothetical protein
VERLLLGMKGHGDSSCDRLLGFEVGEATSGDLRCAATTLTVSPRLHSAVPLHAPHLPSADAAMAVSSLLTACWVQRANMSTIDYTATTAAAAAAARQQPGSSQAAVRQQEQCQTYNHGVSAVTILTHHQIHDKGLVKLLYAYSCQRLHCWSGERLLRLCMCPI